MRSAATLARVAASLFLFLSLFSLVYGQDDVASIEADAASIRAKVAEKSIDDKAREQLLRQLGSKLNQAGELRFSKGEYELATKAFLEADAALKQGHTIRLAQALADLDSAEKQLADFEKDTNPETRPIRVKIGRSLVGSTISMVVSEAQDLGDEETQKKALTRLGEVAKLDGDLSREAESIEKLGQLEFNAGNSDQAFGLWSKAVEIRKKHGKNVHYALDYIAYARWYLGEYDKALELFRQEIELLRNVNAAPEIPKPGATETNKMAILLETSVVRVSLTHALLNVAQVLALTGKYGEANSNIEEAEKVVAQMKSGEALAPDDSTRSILLVSRSSLEALITRLRGRLMEAAGDESGALIKFQKAADIFSQISGGSPSGAVAGLRSRMAAIYSSQGKFDLARANIKESLRIRGRLHQESALAFTLMQASRIELAAKQVDAGLKFARQAKAAALQLALEDVMAEANEVEADALLAKSGDANSVTLEQAIAGYRSAIENYKSTELRPFHFRALGSLGVAYERAGKQKEAEVTFKQAVEIAESLKSSFGSAQESESYSNRKDVTQLYQRLIDLLVKQGRAEEALQYATRSQRRDLVDALPKNEIKLSGSDAALKQVTIAESKVQAAESNLANSRGQASSATTGKSAGLASAVGAARQDYALAIKRLETEQPNLRFTVRPTDLLKLQASMLGDEAIVSYLVTPTRLYIFVVRKGAVAVRQVEVSQNDLRALIGQVRDGLKTYSTDFYDISSDADTGFATEKKRADLRKDDGSEHYKNNLAPMNVSLRSLEKKLITPVSDLISDATTIRLIPNAELFLLPFGALVSEKDGRYLLERYNLVYVTAGDLITSPSKVPPGGLLVAYGDPTEANLDGALEEVRAIQKVFPRSQLFVEDKATKAQLFKMTSAKIVHFATHGHIRTPLESSKIQLAHLPTITDPDLSYGEIYALPLTTSDMIVLSACETALGGISGTEVGVFIEAFRTKTNTVAASLWSVDDFATKELMVEFYRNLAAGQTRMGALRTAQLKLLNDGRTKNPLFWAAFVMYGDGGRLTGVNAPAGGKARNN